MVFWAAFWVIVTVTVVLIVRPLVVGREGSTGGTEADVYADQIAEIEADKERGLIGEAEAATARTEIARRLLRARETEATPLRGRPRWSAVWGVALFVPLFAVGSYALLGMPAMPDQPLADRAQPNDDLETLIARAEARLAETPDDVRGWTAIAPAYQRLGRFDDAARAYRRAREIAGPSPVLYTGEAENIALARGGQVTAEAERLLHAALELDPEFAPATVFLAIAARQQGDFDLASERWQAVLSRSDGREVWAPVASAELARMGRAPPDGVGAGPSAPSQPEAFPMEQQAAIEGMVARLDSRLTSEGGSPDEWARLILSYRVLGDRAAADAALARAEDALSPEAFEEMSANLRVVE